MTDMLRYAMRMLLNLSLLLLATLSLLFFLVRLAGDPALILSGESSDPAVLADIRSSLGLDQPLYRQYLIFLWQAAIVLAIGAIVGGIFGAAVSWGVSLVPLPINTLFKTEHFIVALSPWHFVQAITTAVVMVMIASLVPARRAARLEPGDIVRGTAQ